MKTKFSTNHALKLYTDGGVIQKNPSTIGGTWAWVLVKNNREVCRESGIMDFRNFYFPEGKITNNQTELFAIIRGLENLNTHDVVEICSDSDVSLGRVFRDNSLNNIPTWMQAELRFAIGRLIFWNQFSYTLIGGHPTNISLRKGTNAKGQIVSKWNVLCDQLCHDEANRYEKMI